MDHLYREVSTAFPRRSITHIDVRQEREGYRILRIGFRGVQPESMFRSFLHEKNQVKALVEACLHDAEDLGLTLPYEQINRLLLAACRNIEVAPTDHVVVLRGAGVRARRVGMRPLRPGLEGCLLRGDDVFAGVITPSKTASRLSALSEPMTVHDRKKTVYAALYMHSL